MQKLSNLIFGSLQGNVGFRLHSTQPCILERVVDDPDFDAKIQAAILRQIDAAEGNGEAEYIFANSSRSN